MAVLSAVIWSAVSSCRSVKTCHRRGHGNMTARSGPGMVGLCVVDTDVDGTWIPDQTDLEEEEEDDNGPALYYNL